MEEVHITKGHRFSLDNRNQGHLTGLREVESFDAELVVLATEQGRLTIKGRDLHVTRLDVDKGEIDFSGSVDSMVYSEIRTAGQVTTGVLKRLFK